MVAAACLDVGPGARVNARCDLWGILEGIGGVASGDAARGESWIVVLVAEVAAAVVNGVRSQFPIEEAPGQARLVIWLGTQETTPCHSRTEVDGEAELQKEEQHTICLSAVI